MVRGFTTTPFNFFKMEKYIKINIVLNVGFLILILVSSILLFDFFYNMKVENCKDITGSEYEVSTQSVTSCIRFNNYPVYEYVVPYYLATFCMYFLISFVQVIIYMIKDMFRGYSQY